MLGSCLLTGLELGGDPTNVNSTLDTQLWKKESQLATLGYFTSKMKMASKMKKADHSKFCSVVPLKDNGTQSRLFAFECLHSYPIKLMVIIIIREEGLAHRLVHPGAEQGWHNESTSLLAMSPTMNSQIHHLTWIEFLPLAEEQTKRKMFFSQTAGRIVSKSEKQSSHLSQPFKQ